MGAEADGLPAFDHQDLVGGEDRRDALGDDDDGRVGDDRHQRGAQARVGREVERRERVVEEVDVGTLHECAGDGEALALTARTRCCRPGRWARRARRAWPRRSRRALRDLERVPELVVGRVVVAVAQVARDGAGEQVRPLRHEPDVAPQLLHRRRRARRRRSRARCRSSRRRAAGPRFTSVDLPAPVLPTIASVCPALTVNEMFDSTCASAPGYPNPTSRISNVRAQRHLARRARPGRRHGRRRVEGLGRCAFAHTAARGQSTATNVAIITAVRIWIR